MLSCAVAPACNDDSAESRPDTRSVHKRKHRPPEAVAKIRTQGFPMDQSYAKAASVVATVSLAYAWVLATFRD